MPAGLFNSAISLSLALSLCRFLCLFPFAFVLSSSQAYHDAVHECIFAGPTLFTPILHTTAGLTESMNCRQDKQRFNILLILTDGTINDMETTLRTMIDASSLPMSVLIVGIGSADFTEMKRLDSDKGLLSADGHTAIRDIVQFVP
jgi:hypothetical protein